MSLVDGSDLHVHLTISQGDVRTTSSVTSVDTPDAFFGHDTHNIPSFFSAFLRAGKHPLQIGASIGEELDEVELAPQLTDQDYAFGERPQGRVVIWGRQRNVHGDSP